MTTARVLQNVEDIFIPLRRSQHYPTPYSLNHSDKKTQTRKCTNLSCA